MQVPVKVLEDKRSVGPSSNHLGPAKAPNNLYPSTMHPSSELLCSQSHGSGGCCSRGGGCGAGDGGGRRGGGGGGVGDRGGRRGDRGDVRDGGGCRGGGGRVRGGAQGKRREGKGALFRLAPAL